MKIKNFNRCFPHLLGMLVLLAMHPIHATSLITPELQKSDDECRRRAELKEHLILIKNIDINRINISYICHKEVPSEVNKIALPSIYLKDVLTTLRTQLSVPQKIISPPKIKLHRRGYSLGFDFFADNKKITYYGLHPKNEGWSLELPVTTKKYLRNLAIAILLENGIRVEIENR